MVIKVSIIVPVYNEYTNLDILYKSLCKTLEDSKVIDNYEIIFINDGSSDKSEEKIFRYTKINEKIKLINFSKNFGINAVYAAGLDTASGNCLIFFDADLQYKVSLINDMVVKWKSGSKIIFARRKNYKPKLFFRVMTHLFIYTFNLISSVKLNKNTSYVSLLDKSVINNLKNMKENAKYFPALIRWTGHKVDYVDCEIINRRHGNSKIGFTKKFSEAVTAITSFTSFPLSVSTIFGGIIAVTSFLYGLYVLAYTAINGTSVPGYLSIFLAILFMGGLHLLCIGILSEYVAKIYNQGKERPVYIIKSKKGFKRLT